MKKALLIIFLTGFLSQIGFSQDFDKTKLDNYFSALESNNKLMGTVSVSKDGQTIYSNSIGFSDVENGIKANENTKYRIGSISKTFTAVLVLKVVEEGKLELNQTIDLFFPTIPNADKITIENLLNHRSGIHNFTNSIAYLAWHTQAKTEKEMVKIIADGGSDFNPGSKGDYSNSNYVVLTYILEKVFDKSFSNLLNEKIIQPIGLKHTYFGGKIDTQKNESKSYKYAQNWIAEAETDLSIPMGAGGIVSTPSDLTRFGNALFSGKLLKPESLELMKTIKEGYGLGLFSIPFYDQLGFGHTGGIDGFSSAYFYFPKDNISYALTSNGSNTNFNDVSIAVLSAIYNKPYEIPEFSTYEVNSEDLDKYLGVYSSSQIPLKITFTKEGSTLIAEPTGQGATALEATAKDKFSFDMAGAVFEFQPEENTMILKQGGAEFYFKKE